MKDIISKNRFTNFVKLQRNVQIIDLSPCAKLQVKK